MEVTIYEVQQLNFREFLKWYNKTSKFEPFKEAITHGGAHGYGSLTKMEQLCKLKIINGVFVINGQNYNTLAEQTEQQLQEGTVWHKTKLWGLWGGLGIFMSFKWGLLSNFWAVQTEQKNKILVFTQQHDFCLSFECNKQAYTRFFYERVQNPEVHTFFEL